MAQVSFWEKDSFFAPQDIIIVGAGFTGLWSALHLISLHPGKKITIVERGLIPTGASTRNAGFSCFGSPSELLNDAAIMGEDKMWEMVEMRYQGLAIIKSYFSDRLIGYEASGGYECFAHLSQDWVQVAEKLDWLNKGLHTITGVKNLFSIADKKLAAFGFTGFEHLVQNNLEGGLQPGKLIQALLKKVQGLGVQVLTGIEVEKYVQKKDGVAIECKQGVALTAHQLLLCTNAFTKPLYPAIDITPCRGQVLITDPIEGLGMKGTFHFDKGYYYFRNVGNRLLIGGARNKNFSAEETDELDITATIQQELERFIKTHLLPKTTFTIADRWSGIMAMGKAKIPVIQALEKNVFCCVRMNGMGVALAPVAAKKIATLMTEIGK
jgi:gamma-glutamylputrescine oxidase